MKMAVSDNPSRWRSAHLPFGMLMLLSAMLMGSAFAASKSAPLDKWEKQAKRSAGILSLKYSEYIEYFHNTHPRSFDAVVLLSPAECRTCDQVRTILREGACKTIAKRQAANDPMWKDKFVVDVTAPNQEFYGLQMQYNMQFSPHVFFAKRDARLPAEAKSDSVLPLADIRELSEIEEWVISMFQSSAGRKVSALFTPAFWGVSRAPGLQEVLFRFQGVILISALVLLVLTLVFRLYTYKTFYFAIMLALYMVSESGIFQVILRGIPVAVYRGDHWEWMMGGMRNQYALEGWLAGFCYVAVGSLLILAMEGPPMAFISHILSLFKMKSDVELSRFMRSSFSFACLGMAALLFFNLFAVFREKMGGGYPL
ncbi:hypothetical protein FVE85_0570 [Porphyridium purpureum]|uniref:Uncharacterized protein n=1 Tax=Porphyridium purpureum TaxID=35688 RepID=A0A5J4YYZ0_PORPP|nr:hypothetical protein FVE85_0570 [Porphyridium purpureum]|eukprot:POR2255..scf208_2